jgi:NADPH:quinone reductase-like Zn-dependent oxidoreductase
MDWLPNGVRLTAYSGEAADLPAAVLQEFLDAVAAGHARVPVGVTYFMEDIVQAHRDLEANTIGGKAVVLP